MNNFDIGITTFSLRYDFAENLIKKIRGLGVKNKIILCVNGEKNGDFNENYRKKILKLCLDYEDVFPIFFIELRGLSKMWNSLIIHSSNENILILNDDIEIETNNLFDVVFEHINSENYNGLSTINDTFSFFVVNKEFIDELGYFDERLLGFGEEDGDIMFRIRSKYNKKIDRLYCGGLKNIVSNIRHESIKPGIDKYSLFNREYIFNEKYMCQGNIYFFPNDIECNQIIEDVNLYPMEKYYQQNKHKLFY